MSEAHLDYPGEIHWFKAHGPAPVLGPCPHSGCKHLGTGVIAWWPTMERYELAACGSINPADEADDDCAMHCRAWVDDYGRAVTVWLNVDLAAERPVRLLDNALTSTDDNPQLAPLSSDDARPAFAAAGVALSGGARWPRSTDPAPSTA